MFCVFLQNTPPKKDLTITINHNKDIYTFSRSLSFRHSPILADLILKNEDDVINLDYFHEYDDFQLICDLFNYKRVFINKINIDFLEFAANFLQIQILINKTRKYRNHYNDFIKNPIFKKIELLHHQIFSIFKPSITSEQINDINNDSDSDFNTNQNDINIIDQCNEQDTYNGNISNNKNQNDDFDTEIINDDADLKVLKNNLKMQENKNLSKNQNENINKSQETNENANENQNENQNNFESISDKQNQENISSTPTIQYDEEYLSTVSHLIYSAIISNPLNVDKYLPIVVKDQNLFNKFIETLTSSPLNSSFVNFLTGPLQDLLKSNETETNRITTLLSLYQSENTDIILSQLDTNLDVYLNDVGYFFQEFYSFYKKYEFLNQLIEKDDIDQFQQKFTANPKLSRKDNYINFFKTSMMTSSIKCFKYFVLNYGSHSKSIKIDKKMIHCSIIGGNIEIIRFLFDKYDGSVIDFVRDAILFHKKDIFQWLIENKCHFLSLYNSCCTKILYGEKYVKQKWYKCTKCHKHHNNGCCKFCAKHCHLDRNFVNEHKIKFHFISSSCFCDDECELSKNIDIVGNKEIVEIDDLILLSFYCMNTESIKILIKEGGYILRIRDNLTKSSYTMNDTKIQELIKNMRGYKENSTHQNKNFILSFFSLSSSDYSKSDDDDDNDNRKIQLIPFLTPVDVGASMNQINEQT